MRFKCRFCLTAQVTAQSRCNEISEALSQCVCTSTQPVSQATMTSGLINIHCTDLFNKDAENTSAQRLLLCKKEKVLFRFALSHGFKQTAYHWLPEELVLGVVLAEHKPRVTLQRPGRLNLQHNLVVLQTPLCGDRMRYEKFRHTAVKRLVHRVVLPRPRVGWTSRRAQFSWSLQ